MTRGSERHGAMDMYYLRSREIFDCADAGGPAHDDAKVWGCNVSPDRRTFWVRGGSQGGIRCLYHYTEDGNLFVADRLHPPDNCMVQSPDPARASAVLRRAIVNERLPLVPIHQVPGFTAHAESGSMWHQQGWWTDTVYALPLDVPWICAESVAFDLREGVYLVWPDGSIRLIGHRQYFGWGWWNQTSGSLGHQGDLFIWSSDHAPQLAADLPFELQRHLVTRDSDMIVVTHPEHETITISLGADRGVICKIMPGTSRPYSRWVRSE